MQSPLIQDGGDGGRANRIVTIDVASGATHEYVYDNVINKKAFNSSEIIALNNHQFLIDTRDGKGLGDGGDCRGQAALGRGHRRRAGRLRSLRGSDTPRQRGAEEAVLSTS